MSSMNDDEEYHEEDHLHPSRLLSLSFAGEELEVKAVIAHVDMDAFYAQVEQARDPTLKGKPCGVVQYNPYGDLRTIAPHEPRIVNDSNGSLIAVSYEARKYGVKRVMKGEEARKACPDLQLVQVPVKFGKADLTIYREGGKKVIDILSRWSTCERASIDEAYCDLTVQARALVQKWGPEVIEKAKNSKIAGMESKVLTKQELRYGHTGEEEGDKKEGQEAKDEGAPLPPPQEPSYEQGFWDRPPHMWNIKERLMTCGAAVMADMRQAVHDELGYTCSAGIAPCKLLSKLCSGMHKPNKQTIVLPEMIPMLLDPLLIARIKGLGGDFGEKVATELNVTTIGELAAVPLARLEHLYGEQQAQWIYKISRGIDEEQVKDRKLAKSIACGKTFYGMNNLRHLDKVAFWFTQLAGELTERLQSDCLLNDRIPQLLTVNFQSQSGTTSGSRDPIQRPQATAAAFTGASTSSSNAKNQWNAQSQSRSAPIRLSLDQLEHKPQDVQNMIAQLALSLVRKWQTQREETHTGSGPPPSLCLTTLFLTAGSFLNITQKSKMSDFFQRAAPSSSSSSPSPSSAAAASSSSPRSRPPPHPPLPVSNNPTNAVTKATAAAEATTNMEVEASSSAAAGDSNSTTTTTTTITTSQHRASPFHIRSSSQYNKTTTGTLGSSSAILGKRRHRNGLDNYFEAAAATATAAAVAAASSKDDTVTMTGAEGEADREGVVKSQARQDPVVVHDDDDSIGSPAAIVTSAATSSSSSINPLRLDPNEIDQNVLAKLPADIREEVLASMRGEGGQGSRPIEKKRIDHYFSKGNTSSAAGNISSSNHNYSRQQQQQASRTIKSKSGLLDNFGKRKKHPDR